MFFLVQSSKFITSLCIIVVPAVISFHMPDFRTIQTLQPRHNRINHGVHSHVYDADFASLIVADDVQRDPADSLRLGKWVKLICGASNQDLPSIRNEVMAYTLAGVDCVDMAADPAVIRTVKEGVEAAVHWAGSRLGVQIRKPWLMISVNDDEDPHFRKAQFDPHQCPPNCPRPCERACPADAINFQRSTGLVEEGVEEAKCYGCGRCVPACPLGLVATKAYVLPPAAICSLLPQVDAIEIHTGPGRLGHFQRLWAEIGGQAATLLKAVAVSFPDLGGPGATAEGVAQMARTMSRAEHGGPISGVHIWQADGRPMSGDIGAGMAQAAVRFGVALARQRPVPFFHGHHEALLRSGDPHNSSVHFLQLAGGTNERTSSLMGEAGLECAGVAFGGYARKVLQAPLAALIMSSPASGHFLDHDSIPGRYSRLEDQEEVLLECLKICCAVVSGIKQR